MLNEPVTYYYKELSEEKPFKQYDFFRQVVIYC